MKIGYACKTVGVLDSDMKSCILKNASSEKIIEITKHNLSVLNNIIDYNINSNIKLFRISSDLVPFGSSEINNVKWWEIFLDELKYIGNKIKDSNMRVSVHPGQYTVINSPKDDVVKRSVNDLIYHNRILDGLGMSSEHKIVLHIGGAYGDKKTAIERFVKTYKKLDDNIKSRLVIENDDKIYNIQEVLDIGIKHQIPVIFDNLHNEINKVNEEGYSEKYWIEQCKSTWKKADGTQKIHYSQQAENKKTGSHSDYISINKFMIFFNMLERNDIDIMLEVKDKNLSCVKCINCTNFNIKISELEKEWSKYRHNILERSNLEYLKIRNLLKDKEDFSVISFYNLLENGLNAQGNNDSFINGAQHVWGDFKDDATEKEKETFLKYLENFKQKSDITIVKRYLHRLAIKYNKDYLLKSYYFIM